MRTTRDLFIITAAGSVSAITIAGYFWPGVVAMWFLVGPYVAIGCYDIWQRKHTVLRLYPVIGHIRFLFESIRPEIQQYFVEDDISGSPVSREFRSLIYQRSKGVSDTRPFGTLFDTYRIGYEWTNHSLNPLPAPKEEPKVVIGTKRCQHPYSASCFNISAMSFGSLSPHAIRALNRGAAQGGFYHNTGEGGLSPYHLEEGGDLVWQIGTGYFSCRTPDGKFNRQRFAENASHPQVKMIELKLSQGAKPGHGGILPAAKVNEEIARIRIVEAGKDVVSPPAHSTFTTPAGLLKFLTELRELSGGKPVGFKLCIGDPSQFIGICKAIKETGLFPDFITIDGAEGGTGAAPIEFTNSVGMPLREGLNLAHNTLIGFGLRDQVHLIASGKAFSAFHVFRLLSLGADLVNSARGMMFALGCLQSRQCHTDNCPTGITTQNPRRYWALDVDDKAQRITRYQSSVIRNLIELVSVSGFSHPSEIGPQNMMRRVGPAEVKSYEDIFPPLKEGILLHADTVPEEMKKNWEKASAYRW